MLHISAKALKHSDEDALLFIIEHVLRVKDRGSIVARRHSSRVLFQSLVCEDVVELIAESHVVDETSVIRQGEVILKTLELSRSELQVLSVEDTAEFLRRKVSLSESVEILEELEQPDSVLLHKVFDFLHERIVSMLAIEIGEALDVSRFRASSGPVDHILEAVGVTKEFSIFDVVFLVTVHESDSISLSLVNLEA